MKSKYLLQTVTNTRCPSCKTYVWMLCDENTHDPIKTPWFYICFRCEFVAKIGKGEVPKV
jgi:hypothetical protein